ncbi:sugar nucleotide-binding protein [Candidatus Pelagibacter bacterium]|jgi:dTDP-4-dehydrorhamnose reductase|nr:sugar nucleotide-binding protein [Candidatus Pelagibacter bacterium]|tara:strand:- start:2047 stop:2739 length:693 start_codon:yes stop_codon:yes gene_type:complete
MLKVIVTGSDGRFGKILQKLNNKFIFKNKKQLNILFPSSIRKNLNKYKPTHILHLAGLSRPMKIHDQNIRKSIDLNIIGTCNLVKEASKLGVKVIYLSTSYVYPGNKGNYSEDDPLKPWNNYSWSKLGGECAVQMYKNSLIIRLCMTEKPFVHKKAYANVKTNFIYQEDAAHIILKILNKKGIINVGGPSQTVYEFAKKKNTKIKKKFSKGEFPKRTDMNLKKLKKIIKK